MREREKEVRERKIDREKNNRSKKRGEKIEKVEVVHRKKGKGEAKRDKKRDTEEGGRGYMKIDKELPQRRPVSM